jgi:hypothetical protein
MVHYIPCTVTLAKIVRTFNEVLIAGYIDIVIHTTDSYCKPS